MMQEYACEIASECPIILQEDETNTNSEDGVGKRRAGVPGEGVNLSPGPEEGEEEGGGVNEREPLHSGAGGEEVGRQGVKGVL